MNKITVRVEYAKPKVRVPLPSQRPATFRDRTKFYRPSSKREDPE
jgi:hypothetical protein